MSALKISLALAALLLYPGLYAQVDSNAFKILDKALGVFSEGRSIAFEFTAIKFGSADKYSVIKNNQDSYKSGHIYVEGNKYEVDLGMVKACSDGVLTVFVDDVDKMMIVDSLKDVLTAETSLMDNLPEILEGTPREANLSYLGKETIAGTMCHMLRIDHTVDKSTWYWISEKDERLLLMTEYHDGVYDSYLVKRLGSAPEGHSYSIELPEKPLNSYYGYEVIDNRYYKK